MKSHYDYEKQFIGSSDIAALVLVGFQNGNGLQAKVLDFGEDASYYAYIVDKECEIPDHYEKRVEFAEYMIVYDDDEKVATFKANKIIVYRAGDRGCIIQLFNE